MPLCHLCCNKSCVVQKKKHDILNISENHEISWKNTTAVVLKNWRGFATPFKLYPPLVLEEVLAKIFLGSLKCVAQAQTTSRLLRLTPWPVQAPTRVPWSISPALYLNMSISSSGSQAMRSAPSLRPSVASHPTGWVAARWCVRSWRRRNKEKHGRAILLRPSPTQFNLLKSLYNFTLRFF